MKQLFAFLFLSLFCACNQPSQIESKRVTDRDTLGIDYVDIVHCTHTDYGYTDHPMIAIDLHKKYLDVALDLAMESRKNLPGDRFTWTAEALDPFWLWWQEASDARRKDMLEMITNKQIAINGIPFHIAPFINREQWKDMFDWIPAELYKEIKPEIGMQHDVNGFPRAAAYGLLDNDIKYIWTGINQHWGGSPFKLPTAFWWKMPDNRKLLVWAGYPYWEGYVFFADHEWRMGQHQANNTQYSWPRKGDILNTDEASVRKANKRCIERIEELRKEGYTYNFITLSFTNQWRMDNDGPIAELAPFVKKWNELGLKPYLNLTTAPEAMKRIEKEAGSTIETLEGEWQDWWSFGVAASPRELQAARRANLFLEAAESPVWGEQSTECRQEIKDINQSLCRYYEHTFGSNLTVSDPYSLFTLGQLNEKATFAYRSLESAKWLLARRVRAANSMKEGGLYISNTGKTPYTGWIELEKQAFRGADYQSVKEMETGTLIPLQQGSTVRFWVIGLPAESQKLYQLQTEKIAETPSSASVPVLTFDDNCWVTSATWEGMKAPLFTAGLADLMVLNIKDHNRWALGDYIHLENATRTKKIEEITEEVWSASAGKASVTETPHSWIVSQPLKHPRVNSMNRTVEIFKNMPRMKVRVTLDRISSENPEIFYLKFPFPKDAGQPLATNGGIPYAPYKDHLPNSCKDFFVTDNWITYGSEDGKRIWSTIDAPIVTFGGHHFCSRIENAPAGITDLYAMLYNNVWIVNYLLDCPGKMTFEFDLVFDKTSTDIKQINEMVQTYQLPIPTMLNPASVENEHIYKRMNSIR